MRTRFLSCTLVAGLAALIASAVDAATLYVDADLTTGNNDGTSWENAYRGPQSLKVAMDAAVAGDAVWVAAGTYKASPSTRNVSHVLKNNVKVYGGFAGGDQGVSKNARIT